MHFAVCYKYHYHCTNTDISCYGTLHCNEHTLKLQGFQAPKHLVRKFTTPFICDVCHVKHFCVLILQMCHSGVYIYMESHFLNYTAKYTVDIQTFMIVSVLSGLCLVTYTSC